MNRRGGGVAAITTGVIWQQIVIFALPLLLSNFLQQMYSTIDLWIVGNWAGAEAMASVSATVVVSNMLIGFFIGWGIGASVIMSQNYGAEDWERVYATVHTTMALALIAGAILTVAGVVFSRPMLQLLNTPASVMDGAVTYMRWMFIGIIPTLVYNFAAALLRSVGDSRQPLYFLMVSAVINLVLDLLFVAVLPGGVAGAAIATVIAQLAAAILAVITLMRAPMAYRFMPRQTRIDRDILSGVMRIGIPAGLQSVLISSSNALIQAQINSFGGAATAGVGAATKYNGFQFMAVDAYGLSATTFTGQNIGAGKYDRVKRGALVTIALATGTTLVSQLILTLNLDFWISLFSSDPDVVRYGATALSYDAAFYWLFAVSQVLAGVIRGAGKAHVPMIISLTFMTGVRVVWILAILPLLPRTIDSVYLCYPVSWLLTALVYTLYYVKAKWLPTERALTYNEATAS